MCHTASYYFVGKDPTFGFDAGVPFGLTARQQNSWMMQGGGLQLMRDFMAEYSVVPLLLVGKPHWEALPALYKAAIETVWGDQRRADGALRPAEPPRRCAVSSPPARS